jgi:hypothetical protein
MRETLLVGRRVYEGEGPHTDQTYRDYLTTAEQTASICKLREQPTREEFQALSGSLGSLLKHMVDAAKTLAEGVTHVGIAMANAEAGTLNAIAQRLDGLAATLDKLPRQTHEAHPDAVRECADKLDRAYAALYVLVKQVGDGTYFGALKPFLKKVFPEMKSRYFATRAILSRSDQRSMWQLSLGMQRWIGQRGAGLGLKVGELFPSVSISVGRVGDVPAGMKADALVHYGLHAGDAERAKAFDAAFAELQDHGDPDRADKIYNVLSTLVEDRMLKVEYYKAHRSSKTHRSMLDRHSVDPRVTTPDGVTRFFCADFFDALTQTRKEALFARLQGEYAPLPGGALRAALHGLGWKPVTLDLG